VLRTNLELELDAIAPGHPLLLRYVDNLTLVCSDAHVGRQVLQVIESILAPHGLSLKGQDGDPVDIRDPRHSRKVLGLIPRWRSDHLGFDLAETALDDLRKGLHAALELHNVPAAVRAVTEGWLQAVGPVYMDRDAHEVVGLVMDTAARAGFRELSRDRLLSAARRAHQRWLEVRRNVRTGGPSDELQEAGVHG
jgi:hypothetical protein